MKLTRKRLKKIIHEELSKLLEMDSGAPTYRDVYPGPIGKLFDMIVFSKRGDPGYYQTRIHILQLVNSLGGQFVEEILETLEVEIKKQYSYSLGVDKNVSSHEISEPRFKLMDLQYGLLVPTVF